MSGITSGDVVAMLRRSYLPEGRPAGGIFAPEIGSPCGKRRADLIWLPTTIAGGRGLVGHEVKVSRSDVLAELADPTKADPWAKFCDRWWLVVSDPSLVSGLDIPEAWGILAPPSGRRTRSMTVLRPAPKLSPIDRSAGVERLASWMLYRHGDAERQMRTDLSYRDSEINRLKHEIGQLSAAGLRRESPHAARLSSLLTQIESSARKEHIWRVDDDAIVQTVLDLQRARDLVHDLVRQADSLSAAIEDPMAHVRERIAKLSSELDGLADLAGVPARARRRAAS